MATYDIGATICLLSTCLVLAPGCGESEPVEAGTATDGGGESSEGGSNGSGSSAGSSAESGGSSSSAGSSSAGDGSATGSGSSGEGGTSSGTGSEASTGSTSGSGTSGAEDSGGTATPDAGTGDELVDSALGTYAVKGVMAGTQSLFPLTFQSQVIAYGVTVIVEEGGMLFADETICHTETITEGGMVMSQISDATTQSAGTVRSPFRVWDDAGQGRWLREAVPVPVGWRSNGPADTLPQAASDPRVFDQDMDGHPGVTAHITANLAGIGMIDDDFYLVLLQASEYAGTLAPDRHHTGLAEDRGTTQKAIGSKSGLWWNTLNPTNVFGPKENNPVTMVPVEDGTTCAELVPKLGELFP